MAYISRPQYEKQIERYRNSSVIKVITGMRRCGKSSLISAYANRLASEVGKDNVIYLRLDQLGLPINPTAEWLQQLVHTALEQSHQSQNFYVLLDEIQEVSSWEKVVRRLHTEERVDVYLTGSNAHVLSSDLATLLGGRYVTINVHPLSFDEYVLFAKTTNSEGETRDDLFASFIRYGGMPAQFEMDRRTPERMIEMLTTVYETIILNDVATHTHISDFDLLAKLVRYTFSTSGNLFSSRNIVNALASSGRRTSVETIDNYIRALKDAYIMRECRQFGLAGKQMLRPQRKFYPADTGLRNLMSDFTPDDFGAQLECVVFNELIRRGYRVEVGALKRGEIDYVAHRAEERMYIQVCDEFSGQETYKRELAPFEGLEDSFPCYVLTLDRYQTGVTKRGVRIVNMIDWLLDTRDERPK
ncbi:ATP-binding protein [Collinsella sp. zg1085]|uniref:ATP-binding protein n=1 Tax=Collinsella sp. zg1085 TaxID=2844380 RepID=UPI001C0C3948|nr:ATP-binding protein [Collinsella sp. zg1085]QWT17471.1 ATP-binding protein [Collinsella sp. zg1085]